LKSKVGGVGRLVKVLGIHALKRVSHEKDRIYKKSWEGKGILRTYSMNRGGKMPTYQTLKKWGLYEFIRGEHWRSLETVKKKAVSPAS